MSKRLPASRATNEHRALLARIGASEQAIAGADLASYEDALAVLRGPFGLEDFRSGQRDAVREIMAGRDVLAIMPTGGAAYPCAPRAGGEGAEVVHRGPRKRCPRSAGARHGARQEVLLPRPERALPRLGVWSGEVLEAAGQGGPGGDAGQRCGRAPRRRQEEAGGLEEKRVCRIKG